MLRDFNPDYSPKNHIITYNALINKEMHRYYK